HRHHHVGRAEEDRKDRRHQHGRAKAREAAHQACYQRDADRGPQADAGEQGGDIGNHAVSLARTKSMRSWPQNNSPLTTKVGTANTPCFSASAWWAAISPGPSPAMKASKPAGSAPTSFSSASTAPRSS